MSCKKKEKINSESFIQFGGWAISWRLLGCLALPLPLRRGGDIHFFA